MKNKARQFAFNQATFGWDLPFVDFLSVVTEAGAGGVGIWSDRLDGLSPSQVRDQVEGAGLAITAVNRGGFFVGESASERQRAIDETFRQIDLTARLGADVLLVVPGGMNAGVSRIQEARDHVKAGLHAVLPHAAAAGVRIGLEPFHPALTASRGVINTLDSALDLCDEFGPTLGVISDVYHLWWDPNLFAAIDRARGQILGHHLCDWKLDTADFFTDRAMMGEGVADVVGITGAVRRSGYQGLLEIEIFSRNDLWRRPAKDVAELCLEKAAACLAE